MGRSRDPSAPRAATVLWELACKFPEFPHINFRTVLEPEEAGDGPAPGGQLSEKGQREGEAVWPGLPLPASPGPRKVTRGTGRGQALRRARAQATGQKVAGPEVSVPTDISVGVRGPESSGPRASPPPPPPGGGREHSRGMRQSWPGRRAPGWAGHVDCFIELVESGTRHVRGGDVMVLDSNRLPPHPAPF